MQADVAWWLAEHANGILRFAREAAHTDDAQAKVDCVRGHGLGEGAAGLLQLQHMVAFCMPGMRSVHQSVINRLAKDVYGVQAA